MEWYLKVVRDNYGNFEGRARRKEYWIFLLFNMIFCVVAMILDNILGLNFEGEVSILDGATASVSMPYGWIYIFYALVVFIPGLAVAVRRLHDTGKSGWLLLVAFIPFIGGIWLLILFCTDGDTGENTYGISPKEPLFHDLVD